MQMQFDQLASNLLTAQVFHSLDQLPFGSDQSEEECEGPQRDLSIIQEESNGMDLSKKILLYIIKSYFLRVFVFSL